MFLLGRLTHPLRTTVAMRALSATPYLDFASRGPLWASVPAPARPSEAELAAHGALVCEWLGCAAGAPASLDAATATRCFELYLPVFYWCRGLLRARRAAADAADEPLTVFASAPQGCGKTTICDALTALFAAEATTCVALSHDDCYLTHAEQTGVAAAHADNDLLQFRGSAGTHDLALGVRTLEALRAGRRGVAIPRYDKTLRGGRGDRAPEADWPVVAAKADVILFEGWMGGFKPRGDVDALARIHPGLGAVDANLENYGRWDALADAWLVIAIDAPRDTVFGWRLQQERAAGGGLDDAQVRDFVDRFLPSYDAYCPALYAAASAGGVDGKPTLKVDLDTGRNPV